MFKVDGFDIGDKVGVNAPFYKGHGEVTGYSFSGLVRVQTEHRKKPYYVLPSELFKESPK